MDREGVIRRSDAIDAVKEYLNLCCLTGAKFHKEAKDYNEEIAIEIFENIPAVEPKQGEWIDEAISIINDMQREGIVDYEQAREFRMRARMKGADDEVLRQL